MPPRGVRRCDVCPGRDAVFYCAADSAFLCKQCDTDVHNANSLAARHERVKLAHNGAPMRIERKGAATAAASTVTSRSGREQDDAAVPSLPFHECPPSLSSSSSKAEPGFVDDSLFCLTLDDPSLLDCTQGLSPYSKESNELPVFKCGEAHYEHIGEQIVAARSELDDVFECEFLTDPEEQLEVVSLVGSTEVDSSTNTRETRETGVESVEVIPRASPSHKSNAEANEVAIVPRFEGAQEVEAPRRFDIFRDSRLRNGGPVLRLNYEDVLMALSDKLISPWLDDDVSMRIKEELDAEGEADDLSDPTYGGGNAVVPDLCLASCDGSPDLLSGVGDTGMLPENREARVNRYREKRRSRLFSKKVRYEVRKLNAERRPRIKGRFVKRVHL
jgi:hypothetical protein